MHKKTIRDIDVKGKTILVRLDWNVPVADGHVTDDFRIEATRPTLEYLWEADCKVVVMSHLGRPDGKANPQFSLRPVAKQAAKIFDRPIRFLDDCVGPEVEEAVAKMAAGDTICLENVRFHPEEEENDPKFAAGLARLGDVYVYDAFASYRPHASTEGVAHLLPAVSGLLVEKEVDYLLGAVEHPKRPLVAVIGGAKVSTKLSILSNLIPKVDAMLLTGPIANTFALAQGYEVGGSLAERSSLDDVKKLMKLADKENTELFIPHEVVVSKSLKAAIDVHTIQLEKIAARDCIMDAAPSYGDKLRDVIEEFLDVDNQSTVIWNGPLGVTEMAEFRAGSLAMANAIIDTATVSIIGGGDTAAYINKVGLNEKFTWVSTGGGASLELMSGRSLPCIEALQNK